MKYEEFKEMVQKLPVIDNNILKLKGVFSSCNKVQFSRWLKKGYILRLKKGGLYVLKEADRKVNPSRMFIGCELYKPSYISMEYAMAYYGLIPERVHDITCITTRKTNSFENTFGKFVYQHVMPRCFTGFVEKKDELNLSYFIAKPEKAIVDYIYLNLSRLGVDPESRMIESLRFQNLDSLNSKLLMEYSDLLKIKKLDTVIQKVIKLAESKND